MEPDEEINRYKKILMRFFESKGYEVHLDIPISEDAPWRPHLFVKDEDKMIIDILDLEHLPELQFKKYVGIFNLFPEIKAYVVLIGDMNYSPQVIADCNRYGIGIFLVINDRPKEILQPKQRDAKKLMEKDQFVIEPGRPFGNVLTLKRCFRRCRNYLYWFENNLPISVFETLRDNVEETNLTGISQIKLLRSVDDKLNENYRRNFKAFRDEMVSFEIEAEMRVICDRKISAMVHGRYIYSQDDAGNEFKIQIPPLNSLRSDQWDSIFTDIKGVPPFDEYWSKGIDIMEGWNIIQVAVEKHIEYKINEARRILGQF